MVRSLVYLRKQTLGMARRARRRAMRLPLHDPHITIGPILSTEPRVVAVATDYPLATRDSVSIEDVADYTVTHVPTLPRELMDAFVPPRTPSGKRLHRAESRAVAEMPIRVALGEIVHPTVPSFFEHYPHHRVIAVPIRDMPPSQTALVWLSSDRSAKTHAFIAAAADVVRRTPRGGDHAAADPPESMERERYRSGRR